MPTPKKVRWADSFGRSHEKSPSMPRPALSFATVQCPFWREFWPPPNRLLFGDDGAMLPTLKCQDGAVFSFFLFESYSNFKRLNCLDCVRAGIHDEFKMQQSMRRHSAASWLGCNRPFARDAEMCHRSASIPCKFIDGHRRPRCIGTPRPPHSGRARPTGRPQRGRVARLQQHLRAQTLFISINKALRATRRFN